MYGLRHRRIGLLGGSFNPAHGGHLHISLMALKRLDLDEVWWLVSPQNPLKPVTGMAEFADRLAGAAALAKGHPLRLADGRRQPCAIAALEALDRVGGAGADRGLRPAADLAAGACRQGAAAFRAGARPGRCGAQSG